MSRVTLLCCIKKLVFGISIFLQPIIADAWWDNIQSTISQVALQYLTPQTQKRINTLLKYPLTQPGSVELALATSDFINASTWSDRIKYVTWQYPQSKLYYMSLHFMNVPGFLDETVNFALANTRIIKFLKNDSAFNNNANVISAIRSMLKTLSSSQTSMHDKAIALRLLIDYVADIHQPMHCIDVSILGHSTRGQNLIELDPHIMSASFPPLAPIKINNLHLLWDAAGGLIMGSNYGYIKPNTPYLRYLQTSVNTLITKERHDVQLIKQMHDENLVHWAANSYLLGLDASSYKYMTYSRSLEKNDHINGKFKNADAYLKFVKYISAQQIYLAGRHLAFLLNSIFDPDHSPQNYVTALQQNLVAPNIKTLAQLPPFK